MEVEVLPVFPVKRPNFRLVETFRVTAVSFYPFTFTKRHDWSISKVDAADWLRAVAGIQNSK